MKLRVLFLLSCVWLIVCESQIFAENVRLSLQFSDEGLRLLNSWVDPGITKSRRTPIEKRNEPFLFRVYGSREQVLFEDSFQDPKEVRYEEPDATGLLFGGILQNDEAIFSVRIPLQPEAERVDFFQRTQSDLQAGSEGRIASFTLRELHGIRRAAAVPAKVIQKTGDSANRIDFIFLAEGFTKSQKTRFFEKVKAVVAEWKAFSPWAEYFQTLNIYAVPLASKESGADHPSRGINKNTALDATYDCAGIQRLICVDVNKAISAAQASVPQFDHIAVMVNDTEYGGSGGTVAVFSVHSAATQLFYHETGHSFAGLADEYDYGTPPDPRIEPSEPNATIQKQRSKIKWRIWILKKTPIPTPEKSQYADVIGLFKGAKYSPNNFYRPSLTCLMQVLGVPLDSVCMEAHVWAVYDKIALIDSVTPSLTNVTLSRNGSQVFNVKNPSITTFQFEWKVDGVTQGGQQSSSFTLQGSSLSAGSHTVTATVKDKTALVRRDPNNLTTDTYTWNVTIT